MALDKLLTLSRNELYQRLASESLEPDVIVALESAFRGRFATFAEVLEDFSQFATESLVTAFWENKTTLRKRSERLAQIILAAYLKGRLPGHWKVALEEVSGKGRIDIFINLGELRHVVEVKVLQQRSTRSVISRGLRQIAQYLKTHGVDEGFFVIFDASHLKKWSAQKMYEIEGKIIHVIRIDIRNVTPSLMLQKKVENQ